MTEDYEGSFDGVFGLNDSYITSSDLLKAFRERYGIDEQSEVLELLAVYYSEQKMPLCGMTCWMKKEYDRFKRTGTCRVWKMYQDSLKPKESREQPVEADDKPFDPSCGGRYSLD